MFDFYNYSAYTPNSLFIRLFKTMFCIILNVLVYCVMITHIYSFYPSRWISSQYHACASLKYTENHSFRLGLRSSNNPFILVNRLNASNHSSYDTYDTVLWENGELAWEFPEEKMVRQMVQLLMDRAVRLHPRLDLVTKKKY